jgi:hypothetical protein
METNAVNNAYGYTDSEGRWHDTSEITGYGLTMIWNSLRANPQDGMIVNLNTAMMDAKDERDFSAGINALWHLENTTFIPYILRGGCQILYLSWCIHLMVEFVCGRRFV